MRRVVAALIVLAGCSVPGLVLACSCVWAGSFSKVAPRQDLVLLGEVVSHVKNSMIVKVVEVVKGAESRPTIRIWGDTGALCRPYVSGFPVGTRWLLAVSALRGRTAGATAGGVRDPQLEGFSSPAGDTQYAISVCGDFWLEVRGEQAIGRIAVDHHSKNLESVSLSDLVGWIRSGGSSPRPSPTPLSP